MTQMEPVAGLMLDESNPRFADPVSGQDDAVTALLLEAPSKMLNLADDIVQQGTLNPTEVAIAVSEGDELVVIEGNRRLACLKLLSNPDLASAAAQEAGLDLVRRFKDVARRGPFPTTMEIYLIRPEFRSCRAVWETVAPKGVSGPA